MSIKLFNRVAAALTAVLVALPCLAADEATDEDEAFIEEIVVIATYRETAEMDTPLSMATMAGELLEETGSLDLSDIQRTIEAFTPEPTDAQTPIRSFLSAIGNLSLVRLIRREVLSILLAVYISTLS